MNPELFDILIIGAGPAGAVAAARLVLLGYTVLMIERQRFPRFVIGESLLPHCMESLARAGLLGDVEARGYQRKTGALFSYGEHRATIAFSAQFTTGFSTTYQVPRDDFDLCLANGAARLGATVRYGQAVTAVDFAGNRPRVSVTPDADAAGDGTPYTVEAKFVLDASGYGRVLPRLLGLDKPSSLPPRTSLFAHVTGDRRATLDDHEKILIGVHPRVPGAWYWLIPFSDGRSSVGIVAEPNFFADRSDEPAACLRGIIAEEPTVATRLAEGGYEFAFAPRRITGYSSSVNALHGRHFALLGNAGEFLDPVFSSGVTIATHSADLAATCLHRQLQGETVNWQDDFATPLMRGVDVFGAFVRGWYDGSLQRVIFQPDPPQDKYEMICSILAGYVWDVRNPYCTHSARRLATLAELCNPLPAPVFA